MERDIETTEWYGSELSADTTQMQDTGKGKPIILRCFDFIRNPAMELPSDKEVIGQFQKYIDTFLWKDSLVRIQDLKLVIEKDKFKIFATCQAKAGAVILEKPLTIQDYASSEHMDKI